MSWNICKVKNISGGQLTNLPKLLDNNEEYQIPDTMRLEWLTNANVLAAVTAEDLQVGSSSEYFTDTYRQLQWLLNEDVSPIDLDGRRMVHATPRERGTFTYFTGSGDDTADEDHVGYDLLTNTIPDSAIMRFDMSGKATDYKYIDLNAFKNQSAICEGYAQWKDADNDLIEFKIVPKTTDYTSGENTDYDLSNGLLIIPNATGTGSVAVSTEDMKLVECVPDEDGNYPAGYWDCDWDSENKCLDMSTLTPNYSGTGKFNMFAIEYTMARFGNALPFLGSGVMNTKTFDSSRIGHNMRFKISAKTNGDNHNWKFSVILMMHRKYTVK